jgi:hypothetical protein
LGVRMEKNIRRSERAMIYIKEGETEGKKTYKQEVDRRKVQVQSTTDAKSKSRVTTDA